MSREYVLIGLLNGLLREFAHNTFRGHGLTEISRDVALARERNGIRIYLVWQSLLIDLRHDHEAYKIHCDIKMDLEQSSYAAIGDKMLLTQNVPEWCTRSWDFKAFNFETTKNGFFIIRPVGRGCFGGHGIMRIDMATNTPAKMRKLRKYYSKFTRVVVSEYESNLLLFDGRKFHLRAYLLVSSCGEPSSVKWSLFGADMHDESYTIAAPRAKILTAAALWSLDDITDNDVHDSHAKSTPAGYFFPTDWIRIKHQNGIGIRDDDIPQIWNNLREMSSCLVDAVRPTIKPYAESRAGITIFGLDVFIRDDMRPVLIEVNDNVGYNTPICANYERMQRDYFEWVWNEGIAKINVVN
jgi:hypothetical protein